MDEADSALARIEARLSVLESIDERLRRLEDVAFEGDGLTRAVTRLGLNADALGEALLTVDRNQRQLAELDHTIQGVERRSASKEDLKKAREEQEQTTLEFRKNTLRRIYSTGIWLALALLVASGAYLQHQVSVEQDTYDKCKTQAFSAVTIRAFVSSQTQIERENRFIDDVLRAKRIASLKQLGDAFPIPKCEVPK